MAHGLLCSNWVLVVSCNQLPWQPLAAAGNVLQPVVSLSLQQFLPVLLFLGTAGECCLWGWSIMVYMFTCSIHSCLYVHMFNPLSLLSYYGHHISCVSFNFPSPFPSFRPSLPLLSTSPSPPPEHVPDPEVSCSVGCPNLHCWGQVTEEDCSG